MEGGPGLGKTLLVKLFGRLLGLEVGRVQFTPDLMPADILGGQVLETTESGPKVQFKAGPVFTQLLLDEINRQIRGPIELEAMAEGQVTIAGETRRLDRAFFVCDEQSDRYGRTYPLPEAQADRFLMKVGVQQPSREVILQILDVNPGEALSEASPCITPDNLETFRAHVASLPASDAVRSLIADLVVSTQPDPSRPDIVLGASPRAAQGLLAVARSRAAMAGLHVIADVLALAQPVLRHRVVVSYSARADGLSVDTMLEGLIQRRADARLERYLTGDVGSLRSADFWLLRVSLFNWAGRPNHRWATAG